MTATPPLEMQQLAFNGGELDPALHGRTDVHRCYRQGRRDTFMETENKDKDRSLWGNIEQCRAGKALALLLGFPGKLIVFALTLICTLQLFGLLIIVSALEFVFEWLFYPLSPKE